MRKRLFVFGACLGLLSSPSFANYQTTPSPQMQINKAADPMDLVGRWDITVDEDGKPAPSWLEVKKSGTKTLVASFVAIVGSERPVSEVKFSNGRFYFTFPPQWEDGSNNFVVEGALTDGGIEGTMLTSDGKKYNWKGVKAPLLKRTGKISFGKTINLFNGKDLKGWTPTTANSQWEVKNGILISSRSGANLVSDQKFNDFKLHVEFRYQKGSNSGVYLRGRYETQILDNARTEEPESHLFSGIYGFLTPSEINSKGPDQWQSYDITLIGRMVTVVANGKTVISNQEIPGITGGALDSNEGEPGPIYIQGDHGPIEFRKIAITPIK